MIFNNKSYLVKKIIFENGVFDDFIDATYIITMANNKTRHKNIIKQLKKIIPTKSVYIIYNKGYKNNKRILFNKLITNPTEDLTYTNLFIFKHSEIYNNILILEDDFIFSDDIFKNNYIDKIKIFITKNKPEIYLFGCLPLVSRVFDTFKDHIQIYFKAGTQTVLYNKNARNKIYNYIYNFKEKEKVRFDIDKITAYPNLTNIFMFKKPLIVQYFPETENQKYWHKSILLNNILVRIIKIIKFNIKKNIVFKFSIYYFIQKVILLIIYFYSLNFLKFVI